MRGYKTFNTDWTCRDFQYKVGEIYTMDEKPELCKTGFHFCTNLKDCFIYYPYSEHTKIAEIETLGDIDYRIGDTKLCTNKIKIIREIPFNKLYIQSQNIELWTERWCHDYTNENVIYANNYEGHPIVDGKIVILEKEEILPFNDRMTFVSPYRYLLNFNIITDVKEINDGTS